MLWRLETTVESELVGNGFLRARHVHVGYGQRVRAGKRVQGKGVQGDGRVRVCVITTFFYSVSNRVIKQIGTNFGSGTNFINHVG